MGTDIQGLEPDKPRKSPLFFRLLPVVALLFAMAFSAPPVLADEKTIGVIITGDIKYYRDIHGAFLSKLYKEGYRDKVKIITQTPHSDPISLSNAVRKLIAIDVDVIVAYGAPATVAVVREKTKIPLVYSGVYEPIASKIKAGNVTGISTRLSVSSLLRYLRGIASISTMGIIYNAQEDDSVYQAREVYKLAGQYGIRAESLNLQGAYDVKAMLSRKKWDAIFVAGNCMSASMFSEVADYSRSRRIPTASLMPHRSAIVALYIGHKDIGEKTAEKVANILRGVSPERVARGSSNSTELIFNLKEAVDDGLNIPVELVTEATELIK